MSSLSGAQLNRRAPVVGDEVDILNDESQPLHHVQGHVPSRPVKRPRLAKRSRLGQERQPATSRPAAGQLSGTDLLSPLSDEILLRILSFLSLQQLLTVAPVSRRFHRLSEDSQLWKALYYARFVLPRALRIPGFRDGQLDGNRTSERNHKLHYTGKRALWADGRRGGVIDGPAKRDEGDPLIVLATKEQPGRVDWKRQFKIRHNWSRGTCAVEELRMSPENVPTGKDETGMLVKVIEGLALTADRSSGLRAWDLKSKQLLAQATLRAIDNDSTPSCMAIDGQETCETVIDAAVGFADGSFGVWRFDRRSHRISQRYRHEKSSNGSLLALTYSYPYLLTATESVLVSLYTFETPAQQKMVSPDVVRDLGSESEPAPVSSAYRHREEEACTGVNTKSPVESRRTESRPEGLSLPAPYLLTSLKSHTSRPPLALSIRRMAKTTIASIAYTFSSRQGWSIGIQDLHIRSMASKSGDAPQIITTKLAYTAPVSMGRSSRPLTPPPTPPRPRAARPPALNPASHPSGSPAESDQGPITLCYNHPYLLATLPDNTLILHLCTSSASALTISPGIRLWGHTSGISDAEITARGKAVSVSCRGEEMRVWELEGRPSIIQSRSVEIKPAASVSDSQDGHKAVDTVARDDFAHLEDRRSWVGFDDEMVIVLKEAQGRRESLLVYDFT